MNQIDSIVTDLLGYLSENPGAYAIVAAIVGGPFIIIAAFITRDSSGRKLDRKRKHLIKKLKAICPHIDVEHSGKVVRVKSLCNSVGSNPWSTCSLCGRRFTKEEEKQMVEQWLEKSLEQPFRNQAEALQMSIALSEELADLGDDPRRTR